MRFLGFSEDKNSLFKQIKSQDISSYRNRGFRKKNYVGQLPDYIVAIEKIKETDKEMNKKCNYH